MQLGKNYFNPGDFLLRMDINRHTTPVVDYAKRLISVQNHTYLRRKARYRFIDTIVDHFLREVIGSCSVRIHARSLPDRF
jgi:hypothetical protein